MKTSGKCIFVLIFLIISMIILVSCASQHNYQDRPLNGKYIDVFPLSENVTQYFIRPIEWKVKEMSIGIDFTVRSPKLAQPADPVTFCYTLVKDTPFQTDPFLSFIIDDTTAVTPSLVDSLVSDDNNRYVRFTSQIKYNDFIMMLYPTRIELIILDGISDTRIKLPKVFYQAADELRNMFRLRNKG